MYVGDDFAQSTGPWPLFPAISSTWPNFPSLGQTGAGCTALSYSPRPTFNCAEFGCVLPSCDPLLNLAYHSSNFPDAYKGEGLIQQAT